jgi:putative flavoprotein involved in K+ transport
MSEKIYDVIIVGGGYSGLCAGYYLKKNGLSHVIFERGSIGESWRSLRWDNFRFNSTNRLNVLPGEDCKLEPELFGTAPEFVSSLNEYVSKHQLPVRENSNVIAVEKQKEHFKVTVSYNAIEKIYFSKQVLIASGAANEIKIPSLAKNISKNIRSFHTGEYKNAEQLPPGAVLVVGGAQSGIQIAEDLVNAGRKVYFATSEVGRIPRWYRGSDIFYWIKKLKFFEVKAEEIKDPKLIDLRPPHVAGTSATGRDSLSLQALAKRGAVILGKMNNADKENVFFEDNAAAHVKFADEYSKNLKAMIDDRISELGLSAPAPHYDEADIPDTDAACASSITSLNLKENNINSIIWATGFNVDYSYIKLPVFDDHGKLIHKDGVTTVPGFHFLGYPWLRNRQSPILFGIIVDVEFVIENICKYAGVKIPGPGIQA